jgi:uncharacterized surface protein with fasciclin (FAS1) repeats
MSKVSNTDKLNVNDLCFSQPDGLAGVVFVLTISIKSKSMKKIIAGLFVFVAVLSTKANAQQKDIVDVAAGSSAHTTLVAAVKAAGLVETLKGKGPFTVFAPTNDAFGKLPAGTVETLLKPENKGMLTGILTYHVIAGKVDAKAVAAAIKAGGGKAELTTVAGGKLTASVENGKVKITDAKGNSAYVTAADLNASNGVIHVIDSVLLPK